LEAALFAAAADCVDRADPAVVTAVPLPAVIFEEPVALPVAEAEPLDMELADELATAAALFPL
jgi:hypothetical protein